MATRVKFNPIQDLFDAERAVKRFIECMYRREDVIGGVTETNLILWQRFAYTIGSLLTNEAQCIQEELQSYDYDRERMAKGLPQIYPDPPTGKDGV